MAAAPDRRAMPLVGEPMVEWAVWYAVVMGWRVFPVRRDTKKPYTEHGFKDASTDEAQIRAWWTKWRSANIGLAIPAGWLVVDVDARNDGVVTLNELEHTYSLLPRTLTNLTGSGGGSAHYCFTVAPDADLRGTLGQGLDTRLGEKHYIIVPPSIHANGQRYAWESDYGPDDVEPQPAPAWLMALLAQPSNGHSNGQAIVDDGGPIFEGTREKMLLHIGGTLLSQKKSPAEVYEAMSTANRTRCIPAYDEPHVKHLMENLYKSDARHKAEKAAAKEAEAQLIVTTQAVPLARTDPWMGGALLNGTGPPANDPPPSIPAHWRSELFVKKNGELYPNAFNITHILRYSDYWRKPEYALWYDVLTGRHMIAEEQITRAMLVKISQWLGGQERMPLTSLSLLEECLYAQCEETKRDRIMLWLNGLPPWDGTPRLDTWLIKIAHADDDDIGYTRHIGRRLLLSMVARGLYPGCQYREVVVLEGPENIGKSHIVETLASKEFCIVLSMNLEAKEAHMMLQRAWLAELADLDSMNRTEEARLKAFITMEEDTYIPKYRNESISVPRRAIFVGTTNDRNYLKSLSGNTRFLPLWLPGPVDLDALKGMRDQLIAEAKHEYHQAAEGWWHMTEEVAAEAQSRREGRRVKNPYEIPLRNWLGDRTETTWSEIAEHFLLLKTPEAWKDRSLQMQIGGALRALGFETVDEWRVEPSTDKGYKWHGWQWSARAEGKPCPF